MPSVGIIYRREDSAAYAHRLAEALAREFGVKNVFIDIEDIPPGSDFREHIARTLSALDSILLVIGNHWLQRVGDTGTASQSRLFDVDDIHRMEIEIALKHGIHLIPVLVNHAKLPSKTECPESIAGFLNLNALQITDRYFVSAVREIAAAIRIEWRNRIYARRRLQGESLNPTPLKLASLPNKYTFDATREISSISVPVVLKQWILKDSPFTLNFDGTMVNLLPRTPCAHTQDIPPHPILQLHVKEFSECASISRKIQPHANTKVGTSYLIEIVGIAIAKPHSGLVGKILTGDFWHKVVTCRLEYRIPSIITRKNGIIANEARGLFLLDAIQQWVRGNGCNWRAMDLFHIEIAMLKQVIT